MLTDKGMAAASYTASAGVVLAGLSLSEWGFIVGTATAVLTWAGNMYFKALDNRRKAEEHQLNVERLKHDRRQHDRPHDPERRQTPLDEEEADE